MGKLLTADEIIAASDIPEELVDVPEWGRDENGSPRQVRLVGLTGTERDAFEASITETKTEGRGKHQRTIRQMKLDNARAKLLALCIRNENGERVFTDLMIDQLGKKSGAVLDRLFEVAQRLSGIGEDDLEEMVKN